jgi:alpha-N-arabinofuranosidase
MQITIQTDIEKGTISRHIYGHFSEHLGRCIYGGFWVGEDSPIPNLGGIRIDVVEALKKINIPNLRWPGGCFADEYHWMDGIGPKESRPTMINTHWGGVTENNHFGTHEFMKLCELLGCEPYINGNLGSGTIQEMSQWVEYFNSDNISPMTELRKTNGREKSWGVKYWGVGNENWGCGGNMRPEYYADEYRRYACYCRNYGENKLYRIACGAGDFNYHWTEVLMREAGRFMDGLSLHYYTLPKTNWKDKGNATGFPIKEWYSTIKHALGMNEAITRHSAIMDQYDPEQRVGLIVDEWGIWTNVEEGTNPGFLYQQNSIRDALVAGLTLNIFNQHCDRVHMANLAQIINVLQSLILTEGDKMLLTPTYHAFEMYKVHMDAKLLDCHMTCEDCSFEDITLPSASVSASRKNDVVSITMCNLDPSQSQDVQIRLRGDQLSRVVDARVLGAMAYDQCNTFDEPELVMPIVLDVTLNDGRLTCVLPPHSVAVVTLQ